MKVYFLTLILLSYVAADNVENFSNYELIINTYRNITNNDVYNVDTLYNIITDTLNVFDDYIVKSVLYVQLGDPRRIKSFHHTKYTDPTMILNLIIVTNKGGFLNIRSFDKKTITETILIYNEPNIILDNFYIELIDNLFDDIYISYDNEELKYVRLADEIKNNPVYNRIIYKTSAFKDILINHIDNVHKKVNDKTITINDIINRRYYDLHINNIIGTIKDILYIASNV